MNDWKRGARGAAALLAIPVFCGLALSGCKSPSGEAEAQSPGTAQRGQQIETFVIDPESFSLLTNRPPAVEVSDQATTYTLQSDGDVRFNLSNATSKTIKNKRILPIICLCLQSTILCVCSVSLNNNVYKKKSTTYFLMG